MWFTSDKTKSYFAQLYDRNGDSYFEDCTEGSLKQVFQKISEEVLKSPYISYYISISLEVRVCMSVMHLLGSGIMGTILRMFLCDTLTFSTLRHKNNSLYPKAVYSIDHICMDKVLITEAPKVIGVGHDVFA